MNVIFVALSLIFNCPGFKLAVAVHKGLSTRCFLPTRCPFPIRCLFSTRYSLSCIPCDPYIPILSNNIAWRRFWPVKI